VNVPVVGTITAGHPILAVENIESYFPIPAEYMPNDDTFMLKVKGDSMINVGIFNGDKILVQKQSHAKNGDYVVALLGEEVTVKTFYKENGYYRLQPENDTMEPIIVSDLNIQGKVIGLFRMFN
jgi:repressor LexA